jgi:hypothetical protein
MMVNNKEYPMKRLSIVAVIALLLASSMPASSQILSRGDLFGPGALPPTAGVEVGLGLHREQGSFEAACNCRFQDGTGSGFLGALTFNLPLDYDWSIGIKAGIDFKGFDVETMIADTATIRDEATDEVSQGIIRFRRNGTINATYFVVAPAVKYQFFRGGPFVQLAAGISFLMSSKFVHHRELTSSTVDLLDGNGNVIGQLQDVVFENTHTREETLEDGEIANVKSLRLGALLTGGYDIPVSDKALLSPMLTYDFPISTLRDDRAEDWKISSLLFSVGLKYLLD